MRLGGKRFHLMHFRGASNGAEFGKTRILATLLN
jgi:hypothetical protein